MFESVYGRGGGQGPEARACHYPMLAQNRKTVRDKAPRGRLANKAAGPGGHSSTDQGFGVARGNILGAAAEFGNYTSVSSQQRRSA